MDSNFLPEGMTPEEFAELNKELENQKEIEIKESFIKTYGQIIEVKKGKKWKFHFNDNGDSEEYEDYHNFINSIYHQIDSKLNDR